MNVEQVRQLLWLWLEDLENQTQPNPEPFPEELNEKQRVLAQFLSQPPFLDLDNRPDLRHIPGIGYVPDDFPFTSQEEMVANYFWSQYTVQGLQAYAPLLALLQHFSELSLSEKDQGTFQELRAVITAWQMDWLEGPLPPIHYDGPSETALQLAQIVEHPLFQEQHEEIQQLPEQEIFQRLHPDDIEQWHLFRIKMAQRFEIVKEQVIKDLKDLGQIP